MREVDLELCDRDCASRGRRFSVRGICFLYRFRVIIRRCKFGVVGFNFLKDSGDLDFI